MSLGSIKIAEHNGVYATKMEGDVRLTLCLAFDSFIENMLCRPGFCQVVFDLTIAQAIDSTTLGLMAKTSINASSHGCDLPVVVSTNASITRLLVSMGFEDIFHFEDEFHRVDGVEEGASLPSNGSASEYQIRDKVLEAHRLLMEMNETNRDTFQELVDSLQDD